MASEELLKLFDLARSMAGEQREALLTSLPDECRLKLSQMLADKTLTVEPSSAEASSETPSQSDASAAADVDRNLLFGILAWQAGVLTESQLIAGMQAWTLAKSQSLGEILRDQSALTESERSKLEPMVNAHMELHQNSAANALATFSSLPAVTVSLRKNVHDNDVLTSLNQVTQTLAGRGQETSPTIVSKVSVRANSSECRFQIIRPHARGGLGEVYVAKDRDLNREVALKEIQPQFAGQQDSRGRFVLEAEVTGSLEHPGIVPVYGLGQYDDGRPFYAMRFIKGDSLKHAIKEFHETLSWNESDRRLAMRKLLGRLIDVCHAISYAHSRGVLHRDLKPGNIMLGKYGETLVVDWGLAKVAGRGDSSVRGDEQTLQPTSGSSFAQTVMGNAIGTPAYMPPEQALGRLDELGPASDVYSLGATLYHMLTGVSPFSGPDVASTLRNVQQGKFTPPREVKITIEKPLEAVCLKAMSLSPADRYQSPTEMASDLERYLADEPVSARKAPLLESAGRWVRKHQTMTATAAAILLVAGMATGVVLRQAKKQAETQTHIEAANARTQSQLREAADIAKQAAYDARDKTEATLARSNYFLAIARWEANRAKEANELLELIPDQHRHFAWRLAKRQFLGTDLTCYGHTSHVRSVAFSPDGSRVASGSADHTVKLWDAATGKELGTFRGHLKSVGSVAFSPSGEQIASASDDNTIIIWDVTGRKLKTLSGHTDWVGCVTFSPDGNSIASGSGDATIKLWDVATGKEIRTLKDHARYIVNVCFSPDGSLIASGSRDNTVKQWDVTTGKVIRTFDRTATPTGHDFWASSASFSPDGTRIACSSWDIKLWDVVTGEESAALNIESRSVVIYSGDGMRIASAGADNTVKVWNSNTGEELESLRGHSDNVLSVSFSPDGSRIASGSKDNTIKLWSVGRSEGTTLRGHASSVESVRFSPDGTLIASCSEDANIKLWDARDGEELRTLQGHTEFISCVRFSPDGKLIASASDDKSIKLWNVTTGEEFKTLHGHTNWVRSVSFSPDGKQLISGSDDKSIKFWDVATGDELRTLEGRTVGFVCFSPDGGTIASASEDHAITLIDAVTGEQLHTLKGHTSYVWSLSFNPDGTRIASGSEDFTAKVWDVASGRELQSLNIHPADVYDVCFSADGAEIASVSLDRTIKLWDADTGDELRTLHGHSSAVRSVGFSPDGLRLVSGSVDHTLMIWDASPTEEVRTSSQRKASQAINARQRGWWHEKQAQVAIMEKNWFAATFHFAWLLSEKPESQQHYDALHRAFDQLDTKVAELLPSFVKAALSLQVPQPQ